MTTEATQPGATNTEAVTAAATTAAANAAAQAATDAAAAKTAADAKAAADAAAKAGAPETYTDFTLPEGVTLAGDVKTAFTGVAKELGLPQEKAQLVIDKLTPVMKTTNEKASAQAKADLLAASKADAEIGGDKLEASVADAKLALTTYFDPKFTKFLDESGLGNHPEMIRGLVKAAKALKQDGHITPSGSVANGEKDARSFYPNSPGMKA